MADRIIFVCILILGGVYYWATTKIPTLEIGDPLGPKAFPELLLIALMVSAGMLFFEMLKERKAAAPVKSEPEAPVDFQSYKVFIGVVILTGIFFVSFETLGYVLSTAVYLLVMTAYFNRGKWVTNVLTSVLYGVLSYLIFTKALGVNLPSGLLPF